MKPQPKKEIDRSEVLEQAELCLNNENENEIWDHDTYLAEAALRAVYWKEVFDYINSKF